MADGLTLSVDGGVLTATLDRQPGNRLSSDICRELTELLRRPPADAHVLHLRASGEAFCLGRDRGDGGPDQLRGEVDALVGLNLALAASPLVSVAEVQGDAAGFGVGLAALCDVTIASNEARFWFPEVEIDLAPTVVLTWLAPLVGRKRAFDLTATARRLTAHDARELGLVTQVVSATELAASVQDRIAELRRFSPGVHGRIKGFLGDTAGLDAAAAYALATERLIIGSLQRRRDVPGH